MPKNNTHAICGAKTRSGKPCRQRRMPNGRCKMHGGNNRKGMAHWNFKDGRYSKYMPLDVLKKAEEANTDERLLLLHEEIGAVDARIKQCFGRLDDAEGADYRKQLKAVWGRHTAALRAKDLDRSAEELSFLGELILKGSEEAERWREITSLIDQRRKLVESERGRLVQMGNMMTAEQLANAAMAIAELVRRTIDDRDTIRKISDGIGAIILRTNQR